jgi:hypothetical protein
MSYQDLEISHLRVGGHVAGGYRGQKTHTIPAVDEHPDQFFARVFLDTDAGPRAVEVNARP